MRLRIGISSRDEEYDARASITLECSVFGRKIDKDWSVKPPEWLIKPKLIPTEYYNKTGFYDRICPREYSITLTLNDQDSENFVIVYYGVQDEEVYPQKSYKIWGIPWLQWEFNRWSIYKPDHTLFEHIASNIAGKKRRYDFANADDIRARVPKEKFIFADYDGEEIEATCFIEEREWVRGTGWFRWLKYFKKPLRRRQIDISFSAETGSRKSSWKGGTVGASEDLADNETIRQAFERYAFKHHFIYVTQDTTS